MSPGTRMPGLDVCGISHREASIWRSGSVAGDTRVHLPGANPRQELALPQRTRLGSRPSLAGNFLDTPLEVENDVALPHPVCAGEREPVVRRGFYHSPDH